MTAEGRADILFGEILTIVKYQNILPHNNRRETSNENYSFIFVDFVYTFYLSFSAVGFFS